ncbi:MAG: hypothetical protein J6B70_10785 [Oscillospiraceae bacterium]|nr:hypothetical protein [Oscillospiraceae bacterium]
MKNNKIMRTIIGLTLLVALLVPVTAFAASPNYTYNFEFTDRVNHQEAYHEKGDTEQVWVFTLYNTGKSNVSSTNILGVKMNRTSDNYVDVYRTYTGRTTNKRISYLSYVASDDVMFLGAKKDSDSTSYATLYANGAYNP